MFTKEELTNLKSQYTDLLVKYRSYQLEQSNLEQSLEQERSKLVRNQQALTLLDQTKPYIDDVVSKFSESALKKLESLLTLATKSIFYDRDYSVSISLSEKRGSKCADLFLIDSGNKIPLNDSYVGGGVLVVLGFVIQCFYIVNLDLNHTLFLDESLTFISTEYLEPFMQFLHELCDKLQISIVMITHDVRFQQYADRVYHVSNGVYSLD